MKSLVAGWFSFEVGHATAGDLLVRDVARSWLQRAGCSCDVALAAPFPGGVDWRRVAASDYSHVVFVCGPFQRSDLELEFLRKFHRCRRIGLNLSLAESRSQWNPFDLLLERDSPDGGRADMAFLSPMCEVPVVGVCLVEPYPGARDDLANAAIGRLIDSHEMSVVDIDTRLDVPGGNRLRSPAEIEAMIARVDVLLTTRLHGLVLALKHGTPALAIDPEPGGAKVERQARTVGWPAHFVVDQLDDHALQESYQYCLTAAARNQARQCCQLAQGRVAAMGETLLAALREGSSLERAFQSRLARGTPDGPDPRHTQGDNRPAAPAGSGWHTLKDGWAKLRGRLRLR